MLHLLQSCDLVQIGLGNRRGWLLEAQSERLSGCPGCPEKNQISSLTMASFMISGRPGVVGRQAAAGCSAFVRPAVQCRRRSLAVRVASIAAPLAPPAAPLVERDLPAIDEVRAHASVGAGTPARPAFLSPGSRSRSLGSWQRPAAGESRGIVPCMQVPRSWRSLYQPVAEKPCEGLHSCSARACMA